MQCSANGDEINLSSQGDVLKQVVDLSVRHNVLVALRIAYWGSDFLVQHGCVIDLHNHSLLVKGMIVPLSSGNDPSPKGTYRVVVAETMEVPAHRQMRLMANHRERKWKRMRVTSSMSYLRFH